MKLLDRRKKLRLTQVEIARLCGVSLVSYQMWERGVTIPNPNNMKKLKSVLGISEIEV